MRMRHTVTQLVWLWNIFPQNDFRNKVTEHKMCELFLVVRRTEWDVIMNVQYTGLHVKYTPLLPDFNQTWIFSSGVEKISDIKFHENPSSRWRVVPMRTHGRRRTDMSKPTVASRNFANVPKDLMLYREIIAVCYEIHIKHINTAVWAERRVVEC